MSDIAVSPGLFELCWKSLILGVVQGLTEFLPISSTAHLKVLPLFFGWRDPGISFTAVIQLGSIFAVVIYFWHELVGVILGIGGVIRRGQWREPNARLGIAIALGSMPIICAGSVIKLFWAGYETSFFRTIPSIALVSILMALMLAISERLGSRSKSLKMIRGRDGLLVGCGQVFSLIPGTSRSGITMTICLLDGWERRDAARFSFLLGIPAISLAGLVELKDALDSLTLESGIPLLIGVISSAVVSWIAIDWLLKYLQNHSAWIFVIYRLAFGVILLSSWLFFESN